MKIFGSVKLIHSIKMKKILNRSIRTNLCIQIPHSLMISRLVFQICFYLVSKSYLSNIQFQFIHQWFQQQSQHMNFTNNLKLFSLLILATCIFGQNFTQFSERSVTSTIVTGWWPSDGSSTTPNAEVEESFVKLLSLPLNIIIFGPTSIQQFVNQKNSKANFKFIGLQAEKIESNWFKKIIKDLIKNGQNPSVKDKVCQILSYARMWLLNTALSFDSFGSQELIWVDINAINQPHIASVLDPKNLNTLLLAFKHHFFMLTSPKTEAHVYPNIQKTYFEAKYDIFTSSALFGGKRQAITTIFRLFDDQMKVAIEYDRNLWSEDALFSLLADRSPYLVSYFTPQAPPVPQKRVLIETTIQDEKRQLQSYQTKIIYVEYAILLIALLIAFQIIRFVNSIKKINKVLDNRSGVESQQMSKVNQSRE